MCTSKHCDSHVCAFKINIISYAYFTIAKTITQSNVSCKFCFFEIKMKNYLTRHNLTITGVEKSGISGALN